MDPIKQTAEKYFPLYNSPSLIVTVNEDTIVEREQQAFIDGANWMSEFAEWANKNGWIWEFDKRWKQVYSYDCIYKTTFELIEIFNQENNKQ